MPGFRLATAPSRLGRKQISIYLEPQLADRLKATALARRSTVQSLLGSAINDHLETIGLTPILSNPRLSSGRPTRGLPRTKGYPCRNGKTAVNGWYEGQEVDRIREICIAREQTIQRLGEEAVEAFLSIDRNPLDEDLPAELARTIPPVLSSGASAP